MRVAHGLVAWALLASACADPDLSIHEGVVLHDVVDETVLIGSDIWADPGECYRIGEGTEIRVGSREDLPKSTVDLKAGERVRIHFEHVEHDGPVLLIVCPPGDTPLARIIEIR